MCCIGKGEHNRRVVSHPLCAHAVPIHLAHLWQWAALAPGVINVSPRVLQREVCSRGKPAPWITPLCLAGTHRDFFPSQTENIPQWSPSI